MSLGQSFTYVHILTQVSRKGKTYILIGMRLLRDLECPERQKSLLTETLCFYRFTRGLTPIPTLDNYNRNKCLVLGLRVSSHLLLIHFPNLGLYTGERS